MSEMVERLARALYESNTFVRPWDHAETQRVWRRPMLNYARAALLALREPTTDMVMATLTVADQEGDGKVDWPIATQVWRTMIDEALK